MNLRGGKKRQQRKVGCEEEGSIQLEPSKLAAFVLLLCDTHVTKHMLYLRDRQALLKAVKRWVGEGGKSSLAGSTRNSSEKRRTAGAATFLVKVKENQGEPGTEKTGIQADKAISSKDDPMECHDRTNRSVFSWQEPRQKGGTVSYED